MKPLYRINLILYSLPILFFLVFPGVGKSTFAADDPVTRSISQLQERLVADGFDSSLVSTYFHHPKFEIIRKLLKVNIKQPDGAAGYQRFVGTESVKEAEKFLNRHQEVFTKLLSSSPVEPEVVTAILQVESNLGMDHGQYALFNVFATLALLDHRPIQEIAPQFWKKVLEDVAPADREKVRKKALKRANAKARWAYRELKTILELAETENFDPMNTKSSWAGAFGMPQFLPSSFKAYAKDGDGDGKLDLYSLEDSIASVNHYLKIHGYRKNIPAKRRKAVYAYNHSDDYVNCILTLADKIAEERNAGSAR